MAKQKKEKQIPYQQQIYEQMLTKQLYGDTDPASRIEANYNEWLNKKNSAAKIEENYNAWLKNRNEAKQAETQTVEAPTVDTKPVEEPIQKTTTQKKAEPKREQKKYLTHADVMPQLQKRSVDVTNYPEMAQSEQGGTVDLFNRPKVDTNELKKAGWKDAGEGTATVFSSTYTNAKGDKAGNFTPIVTDAKGNYLRTLSEDELTRYAEGVLDGRRKDDLKLQIGKAQTGKKAIDNAVNAAEKVHKEQEEYYLGEKRSKALEAQKNKGLVGSGIKQLDLSKYNLPSSKMDKNDYAVDKTKTKAAIKEKEKTDKAFKQIQNDYIMSPKELKEAKSTAKKELKKLNKDNLTPEEQTRKDIYTSLQKKTSAFDAAKKGARKLPFRVSKLLADAGIDLYQSVAEPVAGALDDITGSGYDRRAKVREAAENDRRRVNENYQYLRGEEKEAQAQHPGAYGAGSAATQMAMYYLTNPLFDKVGKSLGLTNKAAQFAVNQVGQAAQDAALDIYPAYQEAMEDGVITEEEANELKKMGIIDVGMNLTMPALQYGLGKSEQTLYNHLGKTVGNDAEILKAMDETGALREAKNAAKQIPELKQAENVPPEEIARLNTNPLEADNKQFRELMNTYNNQFKDESAMKNIFTPEDLNASQNRQLAELMDEYRMKNNPTEPIPELAPKAALDAGSETNVSGAVKPIVEAANTTPSSPTFELPGEVFNKLDSRFEEIARPLNMVEKSGIMNTVTDEKALKEWRAVNEAYSDYLNKAMFGESIEEAEAAKKTLDNARKRYGRAMKNIDPDIAKAFNNGTFGNQIGRPIYDRNVKAVEDQSDEMLDIINELEGNPASKYEKPIDVDTTGKRPYAKNQGVSPSIENEAKRIDEWIEEQRLEDELYSAEKSKELTEDVKRLKKSFSGKVNYIKDGQNKYAIAFKKKLDELAKNPSPETFIKAKNALNEYIVNSNSKKMMTWDGIWYDKYFDNFNSETRSSEFTKMLDDFGEKHGINIAPEGNAVRQSMDNVPQDFTIETVNRKGGKKGYYVAANNGNKKVNVEPGKVYKTQEQAEKALNSIRNTPGAEPLQFFGGGDTKGKWKIGRWRTNTAEKTGLIRNQEDLPMRDFAFRQFSELEQKEAAFERYKNSADITQDLMNLEKFDEVDIKASMDEWERLMSSTDKKDLRRAKWLGIKIDKELRDAGRIEQAVSEYTRNTPVGQLKSAQEAIDNIVDKKVGVGTSEALDNITEKIYKAYIDSNGDKDLFAKKVEEILDGTLRGHVGSKTAKKMSGKAIKGKSKILKMIADGASVEEIADQVYKQNGAVKLTSEEQKKIYDYLTQAEKMPEGSYEQEELLSRAAKIATARTPSTFGQIVRSILYNNMLGNFKTALSRNAFGNLGYQTLEQGRQPIAAGVDYLTSKVTGKHSTLGWNKAKGKAYIEGFKKGTVDQLSDMQKHIDTGRSGQKGWEIALANNATTFNDTKLAGKLANNVEYYVRNAMELGDRPFYEANYKQNYVELTQLIDRYGKDNVAGFEGLADEDIPAMIDMISSVRAADSVFQKHGKMSKGLTDIRNGLGEMSEGIIGTDILSTAAGAFTMTPGNMIERAIEYSPLGFLKNAVETGREVIEKKGFNQKRFVDEASRSIAGIPILGATYAMAKNGLINGGYSTDPDEKAAQQEDGFIEYGLNVPEEVPILGGKTLDTSDIPVGGPFMQAGSVVAEQGLTPKSSLQAAEAVLGGSTTQGFRRAFGADTPSYSSQGTVKGMMNNLLNTVMSSGSQLVPSLARQTAQTLDPYKRDLGEYETPEYYANLLKNNIPFLRETLPIKTDVNGEKVLQNQGRGLGSKILENYILPMNMSEYNPSPLNVEATRLKKETGEVTGFAQKAKRSDLKTWDEADHSRYSEEQFRRYKEDLGKLNANAGNELTKSKFYQKLPDEDKVKYLGDMYSTMKKVARKNATGHVDEDDKALNVYLDAGGGKKGTKALIDHYQHKYVFNKYEVSDSDGAYAVYDNYGEKGVKNYAKVKKALNKSQATEDIKSAIDRTLPTLSDNEKAIYYSYLDTDASPGTNPFGYVSGINYNVEKDTTYQRAKAVLPKLSPEKFYEERDKIDKWGDESRGASYGNKKISEKEELLPYINATAKSLEEAQQLYDAYGNQLTNKNGVKKRVIQKGGQYVSTY